MSHSSAHSEIVASHAAEQGFVRTRWWWIRHAPVRVDEGRIYGQKDLPCDCSDTRIFAALAARLPRKAVWVTSNLIRTHQTAAAIWAASSAPAPAWHQEKDFAEQNLGDWQGLDRESFLKSRVQQPNSYWYAAADERAPNGESFVDLATRVGSAVTRLTREHEGSDIIAVTHGGTIRAAIALALGHPPSGGLAFTTDNCSLTLLDHYRAGDKSGWRVVMVNHLP